MKFMSDPEMRQIRDKAYPDEGIYVCTYMYTVEHVN